MISLDEFARIFGDTFCTEVLTFSPDDPRRIRATYVNWSIHQQPNHFMYRGAWMITYERTDDLKNMVAINVIKVADPYLIALLTNDGFKGSSDSVVKYAEKCANVPLKAPILSRPQTENTDLDTDKSIERVTDKSNQVYQSIQFYWDTVNNMKSSFLDKNWASDVYVPYLRDQCYVLDVIWVPDKGLMIEYQVDYRQQSSTLVYELLWRCGMFMLEYCSGKKTLRTDEPISSQHMSDGVFFQYIKYFMSLSVAKQVREGLEERIVKEKERIVQEEQKVQDEEQKVQDEEQKVQDEEQKVLQTQSDDPCDTSDTTAKNDSSDTTIDIHVDFPHIVMRELFSRFSECPEKQYAILDEYQRYVDNKEPYGKILLDLMRELVHKCNNKYLRQYFLEESEKK